MTEIDQAALYVEITEGHLQCGTKKCETVAVDYIVQPMGHNGKVQHELIVPICEECMNYLDSTEWVLLYCSQCNSSQWVNKNMAKMIYGPQAVIWMDDCPKC